MSLNELKPNSNSRPSDAQPLIDHSDSKDSSQAPSTSNNHVTKHTTFQDDDKVHYLILSGINNSEFSIILFIICSELNVKYLTCK